MILALPLIGQTVFADRTTQTQQLCAARYMAFFMPSQFMVGGVLGSRKARWLLSPLCKPGISSAAICFAAFVGDLNYYSGVCYG